MLLKRKISGWAWIERDSMQAESVVVTSCKKTGREGEWFAVHA